MVVYDTTCEDCARGRLQFPTIRGITRTNKCNVDEVVVSGESEEEFEMSLGDYRTQKGCYQAPLGGQITGGSWKWHGEGTWIAESVCFEWFNTEVPPVDCKFMEDGRLVKCKSNEGYAMNKCPRQRPPRPVLLRKMVINSKCTDCSKGSLSLNVCGLEGSNCKVKVNSLGIKDGLQEFKRKLGNWEANGGCFMAPLGGKISEGNITWEGQGELEVKNICFEWIGSSKFPYDCQVHRNQLVSCRKNTFYPDKKCPTKGIAPPTAGHTLLRKIVVDCYDCSEGYFSVSLWGADDAIDIHNCSSTSLKISSIGKSSYQEELGEYTVAYGCYQAPLDAAVSQGTIQWHGKGTWKVRNLCFEWKDNMKFPLDCEVDGERIVNCRRNRNYSGLKCPTV